MLPINQIDKNKIEQYRNNFDYAGLADYMSQYYVSDATQQRKYLDTIRQYRYYGNRINGVMQNATDDQKQALQFKLGLEQNRLPKTFINSNGEEVENKYTKDYVTTINNAGGEDATSLQFMLEGKVVETKGLFGVNWLKSNDLHYNDSGMDLFLKGTGYTMQDLYNMGVQVSNKDGQTILTVSKDNPNIYRIYAGMQFVNTNRDSRDINNLIDPNTEGEARYKVRGLDAEGKPIQIGASFNAVPTTTADIMMHNNINPLLAIPAINLFIQESGTRLASQVVSGIGDMFSSTERDWEENEFNNPKNIYTLRRTTNPYYVLNQVEDITKDLLNPQTKQLQNTYEIQGIAVNGAARAELERQRNANLISSADYKDRLNTLNETYRYALSQSLGNLEVYSNIFNDEITDSDDPSLNPLNTEQRIDAEEELHSDINNEETVFMHAMVGDMIGTAVIVPATYDENGNKKTSEKRYFIKDLLKDKAEAAFRQDTKTRAQMELSSMQTYNYSYDIPEVGKIKNVIGEAAVLERNDGSEEVIDRATALNYMNKAMVYQDAIDMANQNYWYDNGTERDYVRLKDDVNTWSQISMSELYPTAWQKYMEALQRAGAKTVNLDDNTPLDEQGENDRIYLRTLKNQMAAYILNAIGYNFNDDNDEYRTSI